MSEAPEKPLIRSQMVGTLQPPASRFTRSSWRQV